MGRFSAEREALLAETKARVAASVNDDSLIIQAVTTMEQLDHAANSLTKKAREWHSLLDPELEHQVKDHERFLELAATERQKSSQDAMGASLAQEDRGEIAAYLAAVRLLYEERQRLLTYLESKMRAHCPNVTSLAGATIGAKLLSHAGSLERLATVPSSTLQLFGAETALFRHLRDRRKHRSPKYGVLFNHPLVQKVAQQQRGKAARSLADKLSLCAKLDHFKGEFKAEEYKRQLAAKFTEW
jgi:nucleolar protein 56